MVSRTKGSEFQFPRYFSLMSFILEIFIEVSQRLIVNILKPWVGRVNEANFNFLSD